GGRICGVQNGLLDMMSDVSTIVVLHDAAGKPAAADLESKLVESGVRNVQPADYRNFAHGRHNWIGKHPQDTGVIMLTSLRCKRLAESTAGLLPPGIPVVRLNTELDGYAGMLSLLIQGMCAVGELGTQSGIDPGRPGVAEFGRKLYGMGPYGFYVGARMHDVSDEKETCERCGVNPKAPGSRHCDSTECWLLDP
ncbi:MAG: hypothetical protein J4F28_09520, partial [Nitrosopumilaceae archaeon]|nr:hypothetical protein [Nitrosopumilaceae archaeon]